MKTRRNIKALTNRSTNNKLELENNANILGAFRLSIYLPSLLDEEQRKRSLE